MEVDEVELERRLGKIEGQLAAAAQIAIVTQTAQATDASMKHAVTIEKIINVEREVTKLVDKVGVQNGRVTKLEQWRAQEATLVAVLVAAGPFVFWALNRWAGG